MKKQQEYRSNMDPNYNSHEPLNPEITHEPPPWLTFEYNMLGIILMKNEVMDSINFLKPHHFHSIYHDDIYQRMIDLHNLGEPINPVTLGALVDVPEGALKYLSNALRHSHYFEDPLAMANQVVECAKRRDLAHYLKNQIVDLEGWDKSSSEIIADINKTALEIGAEGQVAKFSTGKEVGMRILEKLDRKVKPYSTGIAKLDKAMDGGIFPRMCYLIGGRKKMGKTTLAGTISCNLNAAKVRHLYICCEMSDEEIHQRNLARLTQSYASSFRNDYGRTEEFKAKIYDAIRESEDYTVYLDAPGIPFDTLKTSVAQACVKYKIKGFVLDCLQLVGGKPNRKSQAEHQDDVGQWCATYPREQNLFSIVTAQINQTGNIRGGEGIRMACDQGYEIHSPDGDPSRSDRWLEMIETRYTQWMDVGTKESPALLINDNGPFLYEREYPTAQAPMTF